MKMRSQYQYNERLFGGDLRGSLHIARFRWLSAAVRRHARNYSSVIELGCFDAKTIDYLPAPPVSYTGFDANWEGGLDLARERWRHRPEYKFLLCTRPEEIGRDEVGDICICMDTLEHVRPHYMSEYVARLRATTRRYLFVTVPNEKGPFGVAKVLVKSVLGEPSTYTAAELAWTFVGRLDRVSRREHKGFDYRDVISTIAKHFELREISGIPFAWLPPSLNFTVGIVAEAVGPYDGL